MSHTHLTLEERIGIKLFVFTGLSYGKLPDALVEAIQPLPGAAPLPLHEPLRSGRLGR